MFVTWAILLTSHTCVHLPPHTCASASTQSKQVRGVQALHEPQDGEGQIAHTRNRDFLMSFESKAPNFLSR